MPASSASNISKEWAIKTLRQSLRTSHLASSGQATAVSKSPLDDPDNIKYIEDMIRYIYEGRDIGASFNLVILVILLLFTIAHFYQKYARRRKRDAIERDFTSDGSSDAVPVAEAAEGSDHGADSSSSSTLEGSLSPPTPYLKDPNTDIEQQPLLGFRQNWRTPTPSQPRTSPLTILRSWLLYQPRPLPLINRTLPSNDTTLVVLAYYALNIFVHIYRLPFEWRQFFVFSDRAGYVFIVNLPLLYLLSAKNQPLVHLTGRSYESLNIYHRRVGELMVFYAFVHFGSMVTWRLFLEPEWLATESLWHYFTHPLILLGIGAFVSYEALYFTSLASFRQRWYEVFLASHVALQISALVFLYLHFYTSQPYVLASLGIFVVDRVVWRLGMKSVTMEADVQVLEDGETVLLSANWDMSRVKSSKAKTLRRNILHGWHPADHVFISVPSFGGSHALQAHPFTIASAAPRPGDASAQMKLLIRAYSGFTSSLLRHARLNSTPSYSSTISVRVDGPYGFPSPLEALRASESAVLIAGGSGVAVVFPLLWALATVHRGNSFRRIHFLWVIHSGAQRSWLDAGLLEQLRLAGVRVTIPPPTVEVGRPDVAGYIAQVAAQAAGRGRGLSVVVSGPDGLNRTARNACAREVRAGRDINLQVEKFGW
ncbi:hypothetical protein F4808DRAFT_125376 [Astrocystis sublimbata]|nr:hypothetical protein F4808DRAFT_125376 [Astrocystis sublimbata]